MIFCTFARLADIQHLRAEDVPNLKNLGILLKKLKWPRGGANGIRGYYLQLKQVVGW